MLPRGCLEIAMMLHGNNLMLHLIEAWKYNRRCKRLEVRDKQKKALPMTNKNTDLFIRWHYNLDWPFIEIINNKARHNLIDAKCRWRSNGLDGNGSFREPLGQMKVMQIRKRETQIRQRETAMKFGV